jgi:hypothetical protein
MMRRFLFACLLPLVPALGFADQVYLRGGGEITGVIVGRTDSQITLEIGPGRVSLPMSRVERVQEGSSALGEYHRRRAALAAGDVRGFVELGLWSRDHDLYTQAREAFEHAVALDPRNATAQVALGNVRLGDRFVTQDEARRAQGLVRFEDSWMAPEERDALVLERTEEARARAEAIARRDAEAQREAEAQAAQAAAADAGSGIPFYGGYGSFLPYPFFVRRHHVLFVPPVPVVVSRARTPMMDRAAPPPPTRQSSAGVMTRRPQ